MDLIKQNGKKVTPVEDVAHKFKYSFQGMAYCFTHETSFIFEAIAIVLVIILGIIFKIFSFFLTGECLLKIFSPTFLINKFFSGFMKPIRMLSFVTVKATRYQVPLSVPILIYVPFLISKLRMFLQMIHMMDILSSSILTNFVHSRASLSQQDTSHGIIPIETISPFMIAIPVIILTKVSHPLMRCKIMQN